ncbi:hypothetical protein Ahy_B09g095339 [Arachis hypogaea]|uniref:GRF-type domain-containing protein n=1 Tax=Arachis hypogaea TaxID=3818 RepID=A0A444XDP2_ARAHY|nr:hypothetical protein Ahy_B09g095339 [Arachis hypogaea]
MAGRMETGNGCRSGGISLRSHESNGSSASMRMRRKSHEEACFCGLKAVIKKSGTAENPHRLFYACSRYRKDNHCNYFKWVDGNDCEAVVEAVEMASSTTNAAPGDDHRCIQYQYLFQATGLPTLTKISAFMLLEEEFLPPKMLAAVITFTLKQKYNLYHI